MAANTDPFSTQIGPYARAAVALSRAPMRPANVRQELATLKSAPTLWAVAPGIVAAARYPQDMAQEPDRIDPLLRLNERVSHSDSLAKKAVVYSIGQCNILPTNLIIGDVAHGSDGTTRIVRVTEVGDMASMEERPVA